MTHTSDFVIGLFFPNLSQIIPPAIEDENPQVNTNKGKIVMNYVAY